MRSGSEESHPIRWLPEGWLSTSLDEIAEINPKLELGSLADDVTVSFVPMRCVQELTGQIDLSITRPLSEVKKGYTYFVDGDLLFAKITPCMENGKIAVARGLTNAIGFGSTEFHIVRLHESIGRKFFFFLLTQETVRRDAQRSMSGSAGQLRVPADYMRRIEVPLPPLPEQQRIVDKIEELFTKLDAGVEALHKVKAQLKQYRHAVLKSAFEGKLTEQWCEAHKSELEPAYALLERVRVERAASTMKGRSQTHYQRSPDLPELPNGWVWVPLGQLVADSQNGLSKRRSTSGVPTHVLRLSDLRSGRISTAEPRDIMLAEHEMNRYRLEPGDLLCTRVNGSANLVGRILVFREEDTWAFCDHFIRFRTIPGLVSPVYLSYFCDTSVARSHIRLNMVSSAGQNTVSQTTMEGMPVPLCSVGEQQMVVEAIERYYSVADKMEEAVGMDIRQSSRLRQSIFRRAFEGRLVPQDPSDEPANKLLERIQEERAKLRLNHKTAKSKNTKQLRLV